MIIYKYKTGSEYRFKDNWEFIWFYVKDKIEDIWPTRGLKEKDEYWNTVWDNLKSAWFYKIIK